MLLRERIKIGDTKDVSHYGFATDMPCFDDLLSSNAKVNLRADDSKGRYGIEILSTSCKIATSESPKILKVSREEFFTFFNSLQRQLKQQQKAL